MRRRRESCSSLDDKKLCISRGKESVTHELDAAEQRRFRIERFDGSRTSSSGRAPETTTMTTESQATPHGLKSTSSHRRRRDRHMEPEEKKHRRRKKSPEREDGPTYVYGSPAERPKTERIRVSETRRLGRDGEFSSEEEKVSRSRADKERPREKKIKVVYVTREELKASKHKAPRVKTVREERPRESEGSVHRSRAHISRRKSVAEAPSLPPPPPKRYGGMNVYDIKANILVEARLPEYHTREPDRHFDEAILRLLMFPPRNRICPRWLGPALQ